MMSSEDGDRYRIALACVGCKETWLVWTKDPLKAYWNRSNARELVLLTYMVKPMSFMTGCVILFPVGCGRCWETLKRKTLTYQLLVNKLQSSVDAVQAHTKSLVLSPASSGGTRYRLNRSGRGGVDSTVFLLGKADRDEGEACWNESDGSDEYEAYCHWFPVTETERFLGYLPKDRFGERLGSDGAFYAGTLV